MEDAYNELDSVKAELEKLKAEFKIKTELSESLKKAHNEQLLKFEEAKQWIEKQSEELKAKCEEIAEARQLCEKLESRLQEKELSLRHLGSVNEKLKADFDLRLKTLEGEKRDLVIALDEVTTRNKELEKDVCAGKEQIEGLKSLSLVTKKEFLEAERMSKGEKELRQRDKVIVELEEEKTNVHDQLKWKKEQFKHLEEAHKRIQDQFQASKEDWEREKSSLIEETCSLEKSLDSQTRIVGSLQTRLEMCNNALAREESKRKSLEVQVSEFESHFENVFAQFQEEKVENQRHTVQRDEEIAELRCKLGMNEILVKEMEVKAVHLEQENQELMASLKEFQEAQIKNGGGVSTAKLSNKLRRLEQAYGNCSAKLKEKECELLSRIEKIKGDVNNYKSELKDKEEEIKKLQMELKSSHSTIQLLNEEISLTLAIFKSELSEAYSTIYSVKDEMELFNNEKEEKILMLTAQLETSFSALGIAHLELEEERKKVECLTKRVKSFELMKQQQLLGEEELQKRKNLLDEDIGSRLNSQKQLQMESVINNGFGEDEESCRQMENSLPLEDENTKIIKNVKENLICVSQEHVRKLEDQQRQIVILEARLAARAEDIEACLQDRENAVQTARKKDIFIENLQKDISMLNMECRRREIEAAKNARFNVERGFMEEKQMLLQFIDEKEQTVTNLKELAASLERELTSTVSSSFTDVVEKQVKIDALTDAVDRRKCVTDREIEEKNKLVIHLEEELCSLHRRLTQQEECFLSPKQEAEQLQALMENKILEAENLMDEQRRMAGIIKQLEFDKGVLVQDSTKLSIERENLLAYIQKVCDHVGKFSSEDAEMMKVLGKMLPRPEEETEPVADLTGHDELCNSTTRENADTSLLATTKKLEASSDERSPLKEVN